MNIQEDINRLLKSRSSHMKVDNDSENLKINFAPMYVDHVVAGIICMAISLLLVWTFFIEPSEEIHGGADVIIPCIFIGIFLLTGGSDFYKAYFLNKAKTCIVLNHQNELSVSDDKDHVFRLSAEKAHDSMNQLELKSKRKVGGINGIYHYELTIRCKTANDAFGKSSQKNECIVYGLSKQELDWLLNLIRTVYQLPKIERTGGFINMIRHIRYYTPDENGE